MRFEDIERVPMFPGKSRNIVCFYDGRANSKTEVRSYCQESVKKKSLEGRKRAEMPVRVAEANLFEYLMMSLSRHALVFLALHKETYLAT